MKGGTKVSYQNKEMAIGYILRASLDAGSTTKELVSLYYKLNEAMNDHIKANRTNNESEMFNNYLTYDFMVFTNRELGADEKRISEIGSNLYYCYDMYTVDEAQGFHDAFKRILRVR